MQPQALPRDVARLCLLLSNHVDDLGQLTDESRLAEVWQQMGLRLQAATDQHAAMTAELDDLSRLGLQQLAPEQVMVLVRAIKVQSQVLQLYVGDAPEV